MLHNDAKGIDVFYNIATCRLTSALFSGVDVLSTIFLTSGGRLKVVYTDFLYVTKPEQGGREHTDWRL